MMPLEHAYDALGDALCRFRNDMLRDGTKSLEPQRWVEEFRSYLLGFDMDRHYRDVLQWLADVEKAP